MRHVSSEDLEASSIDHNEVLGDKKIFQCLFMPFMSILRFQVMKSFWATELELPQK